MSTTYKEIKVDWISRRGFITLIISSVLSYLTWFLLPWSIILLPANLDRDLKQLSYLLLGLVSTLNLFVGTRLTFQIGGKRFTKQTKYFFGIWYLIFGFRVLGILILREKVRPRKEFRSENPDIVEGYREGYVFKKIDSTYNYNKKMQAYNKDSTYWLTKKANSSITVALWVSGGFASVTLLLGIIFTIVGAIYYKESMDFENKSILLPIGIGLLLWQPAFNALATYVSWISKARGWTTRRHKVIAALLSLFCLNFVSAYFMVTAKLGYNTDDYEEVSITQVSSDQVYETAV